MTNQTKNIIKRESLLEFSNKVDDFKVKVITAAYKPL